MKVFYFLKIKSISLVNFYSETCPVHADAVKTDANVFSVLANFFKCCYSIICFIKMNYNSFPEAYIPIK